MPKFPRIKSSRAVFSSPWIKVLEKEVQFAEGREVEKYYCLDQADYVAMVARLPDGRFAVVRQFRPAVEAETYELPAGLIDSGESPEDCCRRELKEETGLTALKVQYCGPHQPDTGRHQNRQHIFYVETSAPDPAAPVEEGLSVEFIDAATLKEWILARKFQHLLHLAALLVVDTHVGIFARGKAPSAK